MDYKVKRVKPGLISLGYLSGVICLTVGIAFKSVPIALVVYGISMVFYSIVMGLFFYEAVRKDFDRAMNW